jgi:hypothetical protein
MRLGVHFSRRLRPLAALILLALPAGALSARLPEIVVEAPPELEGVAERLRSVDSGKLSGIVELVGLGEPGPPIRVILAPEGSENAVSTPPWVSGYAYGSLGVVVLFPERTPSYPDSNLPELLRHEIAHVLIARAAGGNAVPRWFDEGLATLAADVWRINDRSRLAWTLVTRGESSLEEVERMFAGDRGQIARAYAQSSAFVRDVALRYRSSAPAEILALVRIGVPFEEAFLRGTGQTLAGAERSFWRRHSFWYRWFPILTSSITGWTFITLLFLLAAWLKRRRTEEIRRGWEEEERWLEEIESGESVVRSSEPLRPN